MAADAQPQSPFMLQEIHEQPAALERTLERYVRDDAFVADAFAGLAGFIASAEGIVIAASGSSRHAGLAAEVMLEDLAGIPVDVEYASEFAVSGRPAPRAMGVVVISQSGETADTLAALRKAIDSGRKTVAITNVAGSSMAREATISLPTCAGLEKAIPATKSFTSQLLVLHLLALYVARQRGKLEEAALTARLADLAAVPALLAAALPRWETEMREIAARYADASTFLYLGRGVHYAIAREGALKLKESSYVHAEGYPTGELKHGPNALVSDAVPLVVLATVDRGDDNSVVRYDKTLQLMRDMRAQGARILALVNEGDNEASELATDAVAVPAVSESLLPLVEVVPLQLFAYFIAGQRGVDVDRPRNLVKAVVSE